MKTEMLIPITRTMTPYDTGRRGEPNVWSTAHRDELAAASPIDRSLLEDRFGKVDIDGDGGETLVTIWLEYNEAGQHIVHIQEQTAEVLVQVHS